MKNKILLKGPVLSQSGYGEQARFALRALRSREDIFDIYIVPIPWGKTGWINYDNEERAWIDERIRATQMHNQQGGTFDASVQVTIPNEWENLAPVNIGYTAGIETTKVAPIWLQKANQMNKIIVVSNHSRDVYLSSTYQGQNKNTGQVVDLRCTTPIDVVNYPVIPTKAEKLNLNLDYDFNYLAISQWGPRKNFDNLINWFIEENFDQEVGLVLKTSIRNNCILDRRATESRLKSIVSRHKDIKCKIYLLHGDLTAEQMSGLYNHKQIKCLISTTHGEGYGLPLFEAAYNGLPVVTHNWSGQADFLSVPEKSGRRKPLFATVEYDLGPVQKQAVWEGVIEADSMWAYPREASFKKRLREVKTEYRRFKRNATKLKKHLEENFTEEKLYSDFVSAMGFVESEIDTDYMFVSDLFSDQLIGGAELSLDALVQKMPKQKSAVKVNSAKVTEKLLELNKDKTWIFGNIAQLNNDIVNYISNNLENYYFIEYDYKFCDYRNPVLYSFLEGTPADYGNTERGQAIVNFINNSKKTFFMSEGQKEVYQTNLQNVDFTKTLVLSSTFQDEFFDTIQKYSKNTKEDKWLVLGSRSWVKGTEQSQRWCEENNLEYEVVSGLHPTAVLEKISKAKGVCFLPAGYDTCPRFVIEAKLLGCELQLNENVQHAQEEWFNTDNLEDTVDYLKGRASFFWSNVD